MRWRTAKSPSTDNTPYQANPYWFAWYPVVAYQETRDSFTWNPNNRVWVWWEYVRVERETKEGINQYGFVCQKTHYTYFVTEPDKLPINLRPKVKS